MVNPMIRNIVLTLIILSLTLITAQWLLTTEHPAHTHTEMSEADVDFLRGPHNGRLLEHDGFAVEITIFETGVPPEFRVYPYWENRPVSPSAVNLEIRLSRTGNVVDNIGFTAEGDLLRGNGVVNEPHSFDVSVTATYQGKTYQWDYASYEGRTVIPSALASEAGIITETAGPATILETIKLSGRVEIDPNRVSQVRPRFPGIVKRLHAELGDVIKAGATLLTVESSESLRDYQVTAPISGLIIKRNVQPGEVTADQPLFTIVDLSRVWVELDIFSGDIGRVQEGQQVSIKTLDGYTTSGTIERLSPLSSHASQSIHARVVLDNTDGKLRPGQFVHAVVTIAEHPVALAVRQSGIQGFRDFQVVFARFGDTYEVRMLELGINDAEWSEVVGGLVAGTEYVTGNSYLIKADIEKSGASHDH
jgi:cobalt-zinc-cadmium efflux system membrane fusion protein